MRFRFIGWNHFFRVINFSFLHLSRFTMYILFYSSLEVAKQEEKLQLDGLQTHNYLRHLHGSQPLKLDTELSRSAKNWAKYIASSDRCVSVCDLIYEVIICIREILVLVF